MKRGLLLRGAYPTGLLATFYQETWQPIELPRLNRELYAVCLNCGEPYVIRYEHQSSTLCDACAKATGNAHLYGKTPPFHIVQCRDGCVVDPSSILDTIREAIVIQDGKGERS